MSWGEIKKALNSTLGTEDFKPLDEILVDQNRMVASDNVYDTFPNASVSAEPETDNTLTYPIKLKMIKRGSANIEGIMYRPDHPDITAGTIRIFKNDVEIFTFTRNAAAGEKSEPFSTTITFEPNDVFYITIYVYTATSLITTSVELQNLTMKGTVVQNVFLEI